MDGFLVTNLTRQESKMWAVWRNGFFLLGMSKEFRIVESQDHYVSVTHITVSCIYPWCCVFQCRHTILGWVCNITSKWLHAHLIVWYGMLKYIGTCACVCVYDTVIFGWNVQWCEYMQHDEKIFSSKNLKINSLPQHLILMLSDMFIKLAYRLTVVC